MGLFSGLKKRKSPKAPRGGANEQIPLATDSLSRKDKKALGRAMKKINKEVPILHYLKPKALSLSYLADHLQQYSQNKDGAVRVVSDNDGTKAYTVLIVTEQMFEDAGFSTNKKQNPKGALDLSQLAAQIADYQVATATTVLDYEKHRLVVIPTQDTLDALAEYDEFKNIEFKWAAFPQDDSMQDVRKAMVFQLANTVSLAELQKIAVDQSDLAMNDSNELAIVDDDQPLDDNSQDMDDGSDDNAIDDGFDPTDSLDDDDPAMPDFSGNGAGVDTTVPDINAQGPIQPVQQPVANNGMPAGNMAMPQATGNAAGSTSMDDQTFSQLMDVSGMNNTDSTAAAGDIDLDAVPDDDGNVANNNNQAPDIIPAAQSADEFAANMGEMQGAAKTFSETIDQDLQLYVDYSIFDNQSEHRHPIQFTIEPAKEGDQLGQLANQYRRNYNAELKANKEAQENALREVFASRAREAASYISQRLNAIKGNNSKLAQKEAEIEKRYQNNRANFEQTWPVTITDRQHEFEQRKLAAGEAAKTRAMQDYENNNRAAFENNLKAERSREEQAMSSEHMRQLAQLQAQKIKIGQAAYQAVLSQIMQDINKVRQEDYEENKQLFQHFDRSIHEVLDKYYETEQNRQVATAKMQEHDHAVENAQAKAVQIEKEYKAKLDQVQKDADERISKISRISDENVHQAKETYQSQIESLKDQLEQANRTIEIDTKKHQAEIAQVKSDSEDRVRQARAEHAQADKRTDAQFDRSRKNMIFILILSVVASFLVGAMIALAFKSSHSQPQQQPVQQQQTTQSTTKSDDDDSKTPTKVYNYYGGSSDSSSSSESKSSNSSKSTASTSSHNTHSTSADEDE